MREPTRPARRRGARALALGVALLVCAAGPGLARRHGKKPERATAATAVAESTPVAEGVLRADALISRLPEREGRTEVRAELLALGSDAVTAFLARRQDPELTIRWEFANVLGDLQDERALPGLADNVLRDESPHVRWRSLWALGEYAPERREPAVVLLREGLASPEPSVAWNAAVGLAYFDLPDGLELLHAGLRSADEQTAWEAVDGLGHVHDARTPDLLVAALPHLSRRVRHEAILSLGRLGGPVALAALREALASPEAGQRWRACIALEQSLGVAAIPDLEKIAATDEDPDVMAECGRALGRAERARARERR